MTLTNSFVERWITERQTLQSTNFKDNIRRIDAIIAFELSSFCLKIESFFKNLKTAGLHLEFAPSVKDRNLIYTKIHAPHEILIKYAKRYNIHLRKDQTLKFEEPKVPLPCMETVLNSPHPDRNHPDSKKAWTTISKLQPTGITTRERIVIVFAIMDYMSFGNSKYEVGYKHLLDKGMFLAAYPLHDGPWEWPTNDLDPINDRQLLSKYWANFSVIFKQQPLNVIENYYGYEVAIYFAWIGFYNKMLMYASLMGIFTFLCGIYFIKIYDKNDINTYCSGDHDLCAEQNAWQRLKFSNHCIHTYIVYMNSNLGTYIYSCAIVIWCTVFKELWKRKLNILNAKWNKTNSEDFLLRPQFVAAAKHTCPHKYTGEPELYFTFFEKFVRYSGSLFGLFCLLTMVIGSLIGIICVESYLKSIRLNQLTVTVTVCCLSAILITVSEKWLYDYLIKKLTKFEVSRTELAYEKSLLIKAVIFAFANNYGRLIYIAFLKGKFSIPSETLSQICTLPGCVFEVICLLFTLLLFKPFVDNLVEVQKPLFLIIFRKITQGSLNLKIAPRWEREYYSNELGSILCELEEMIIQFGQVTFFSACCPLAPVFALIHNLVEIRVDATKINRYHQRPIERKQITSMVILFDIFESMTYVAIIVNAIFMAYTCNIVYLIYYYSIEDFKHSYFDFHYAPHNDCYVSRPYHHRVSRERFAYQAGLTLFLIIFGFAVASVLSYIIPDCPRSLREYLHHHERKQKNK